MGPGEQLTERVICGLKSWLCLPKASIDPVGASQNGRKDNIFSRAKRFLCMRSTLVLIGLWVIFGLLVYYAQVRAFSQAANVVAACAKCCCQRPSPGR